MTPAPPGGFTALVTTVTITPAGGVVGPVTVDGAQVTVHVPAGAFPEDVQLTITAPHLPAITPMPPTLENGWTKHDGFADWNP